MTEIRLALVGLGNVSRAFLKLLSQKITYFSEYGFTLTVVGVATRSHGIATNPAGINPALAIDAYLQGESIEKFHTDKRIYDTLDFIHQVEADILIESMPYCPDMGQPAIDYLISGLNRGLHVITVNKSGPAFAYRQLANLAREKAVSFLHEGTVLDGTPVFSLVRRTLPATQITGFRGVINSTTNFILTAMEEGLPLGDALRQTQALGIAETDPKHDLEGWDAAAKTAILVNALMDGNITPTAINRTGIQNLTTRTVIEATRQGRRFKLLAEAIRRDDQMITRVTPRLLPLTNPLAHVTGTAGG
jgi:homoserine dehydrogenase